MGELRHTKRMLQERVSQFLHDHGIWLNKNLGQHFLISDEVLDAIMEAADVQQDETIVEIGPGIGILTDRLLASASKVIAIELDTKLIPLLKEYARIEQSVNKQRVMIISGNALQTPMPSERYKIVANIPYHITSPLLRHIFLESSTHPTSVTLLIQREVAETICDTESAGMLTILVALFGSPRIVTHVDPECFLPPPEVDSTVLHIDCFDHPKADTETIEQMFKLTKLAFSQKRKMLSNTLGTLPNGPEVMMKLNIDPKRRPQTLSIDEWIALATALKK